MRLSDYRQIFYGKEDPEKEDLERKDIVYQVYLGDRQVWERTSDEDTTLASNKITTTWYIAKDLTLKNVTDATTMTGTLDWGDGSIDDWRSGEYYTHYYTMEGEYNITFDCTAQKSNASAAQIAEYGAQSGGANKLIGVTLSKIPFSDHVLGDVSKGVFEDVTTIEAITVPSGVIYIPPRLFYNTSFETLTIPAAFDEEENELEITVGANAFVSDSAQRIRIESKSMVIGNNAFGYDTEGNIVEDLVFECYANSPAYTYAINNNITPTIIT